MAEQRKVSNLMAMTTAEGTRKPKRWDGGHAYVSGV